MIRSGTRRRVFAGPFKRQPAGLWLAAVLAALFLGSAEAQQPTNVAMVVTNDATIDWLWGTQFVFAATSAGNGAVSGGSNEWYDQGTTVEVTAVPAIYYHFVSWTGTVDATTNPLALTVDQPLFLVAQFAENLATNGTPEWWLAAYGLTNRDWDTEALDDQDQDGMPTWQEHIADTDPTNKQSVLALTGILPQADGVRLDWKGGVQATQYVEYRSTLTETAETWVAIFTNLPPVATSTNIVDAGRTNQMLFYRIKAER